MDTDKKDPCGFAFQKSSPAHVCILKLIQHGQAKLEGRTSLDVDYSTRLGMTVWQQELEVPVQPRPDCGNWAFTGTGNRKSDLHIVLYILLTAALMLFLTLLFIAAGVRFSDLPDISRLQQKLIFDIRNSTSKAPYRLITESELTEELQQAANTANSVTDAFEAMIGQDIENSDVLVSELNTRLQLTKGSKIANVIRQFAKKLWDRDTVQQSSNKMAAMGGFVS